MKPALLVNENFPAPSTEKLRSEGWDVLAIAEQSASLPDREVMESARTQKRWLVTFDRDYGELIFKRGLPAPPAVILIREKHYRPHEPAAWVLDLLRQPQEIKGYFAVLTRDNLRKRPLLRVHGAGY